ncbi:hypothetical protein EXN66_Car013208 [Channa argus]|uniref:Secreted protein n=1 Tax=Channa argus TaxID=215402 RepID=A0A6G1Q5I1_CHAAH|nr:hypothetical protein EXN66_Car013208 [Channa argus]
MFCTYIALFYLLALKAIYTASYSPIHTHNHTHTHTPMGGAAMQLANSHWEQLSWGSVSCSRTLRHVTRGGQSLFHLSSISAT